MSFMVCKAVAVLFFSTVVLGLPSCGVMAGVEDSIAPGYYDRPALVRGPARAGSVVGGVAGLALAVVLWPFTKGLNLLLDEPLGYSEREWTLLPVTATAAAGHYALGLPGDVLHLVLYRAWVAEPVPVDFDHVPPDPGQGREDSTAGAGR